MSRYRAAFYHLLISLVALALLACLVRFVWYPGFFFAIDGGWEGLRIIVGVTLVLGPGLTLIVFRSGKPGLGFDLTLIGLFQGACLLAGLYVIYSERPTFFVYYEARFYSSSEDTFTRYGLEPPDWRDYADASPALVYVRLPDNAIEEADVRKILYDDQVPLWTFAPWYAPLSEHIDTIVTQGVPREALRSRDRDGNLDRWFSAHGGNFDDYAFIPIRSRYRNALVGIRKSDRQLVGIVEIPAPLASASAE